MTEQVILVPLLVKIQIDAELETAKISGKLSKTDVMANLLNIIEVFDWTEENDANLLKLTLAIIGEKYQAEEEQGVQVHKIIASMSTPEDKYRARQLLNILDKEDLLP